jgi:serine/threonine protein kinase
MMQYANYRNKFKDISIYSEQLGSGLQSIVDLNQLVGIPRIQSPDLNGTRDINLNFVAIKNYKSNRFDDIDGGAIKELNILFRLMGCPHLIQLLDVDILIVNQKMILRMMLPYHTSDLTDFIKKFDFAEKLKYCKNIIDQLLNALFQLSIKGIIHRDIKPDNILIDYEYDKETKLFLKEPKVYLSDFGLSVQLPCDRKFRNIKLSYESGTPLYFSPELLSKHRNYDEKIDMWGLGITLVTYFLEDEFTYPSTKSYDLAYDIAIDAIIYEILDNLVEDHSFKSFMKLSFHDHINLKKVFNNSNKSDYYKKIPENIINLITSMLEVNPVDRLNIISLFPQVSACPGSDKQLEVGPTKTDLTLYYNVLHKMLDVSNDLKLDTRIFISAINLLNKYIHTYDVENLLLIGASCLYITDKVLNENTGGDPRDYIDMFDHKFTYKQFQLTEILILQNTNYMVSSCYVDEFIDEVANITRKASLSMHLPGVNDINRLKYAAIYVTYPLLDNMYIEIEKDGVFVGELFDFEMTEYLIKVNKS